MTLPHVFSIVHRVQFSETDSAGIVHFSNYFRMMEEVEHAFFRSLGLSVMMTHRGRRIGWPRVAAGCEYFGPVRFEDEVELRLGIARLGEKSMTCEMEFLVGGRRVALGKTTAVCCALAGGKMRGIAIPPDIREKLSAAVSGSQTARSRNFRGRGSFGAGFQAINRPALVAHDEHAPADRGGSR